jgi:FixJ family two-component response regulator
MRMPEVSGLRLFLDLKEKFRMPPPVIFVTAYADVTTAIEAMKEGAFDYVIKPVQGDKFLEKVQAAFARSRELHAQRLAQSAHDARLALLTPKEREVLQLILRGGSTKDIAESLQGSTRTIEHHRARIMSKLHVNSLVELMALFIDERNC